MGEHDAREVDEEALHGFTRALLDDVAALEAMLEANAIETGPRRMGAEQELFFVDAQLQPAPLALEVLRELDDPRLTTEMALFNFEANLTPRVLGGHCLRELEAELNEVLALIRHGARAHGADVVMAGILPTLRQSHLSLDRMTPLPRYRALNEAMRKLHGGDFHVRINGLDELDTSHDSVLMESCNTSFQVHLQVAPREFTRFYNAAQLATAPVLAAAVNAPLLFGKRLWQETRIALFERSVDERSETRLLRGHTPRVTFGQRWLDHSVLEIFREDIARFRIVLQRDIDEPSTEKWQRGEVPKLSALALHNGTVYRWNRACYGITDGKPHLRVEQRALPAGPSIVDEVANGAFFFGLTLALAEAGIEERVPFDDARANFLAAAREGLKAPLAWFGRSVAAGELVERELLELAKDGLARAGVDGSDVDRYLGVVQERVKRGRTGAAWMLASAARMDDVSVEERDRALTAAMLRCQQRGAPGHAWPLARAERGAGTLETVAQIMSGDLFTVRPDDLIDLAASVMSWQHVRHVPVENDAGQLVGLLTLRHLLPLLSKPKRERPLSVRELMDPAPPTVTPATPIGEALQALTGARSSCLAVIDQGKLVGIVTEHDFMMVAARLLGATPAKPHPHR